jgi:hypothetical protein
MPITKLLFALSVLAICGCSSLGFKSHTAKVLPLPESPGKVCLSGPHHASTDSCELKGIQLEEISEAGAPIIYRFQRKDAAPIFITTLEHCGRNYSAETMLRQLFANSESVRITQLKDYKLKQQEFSRSSARITVDEQNVSLEIFSMAGACFQDWIFWKIDADNHGFKANELKSIEQVFEAVWSLN